MRRADANGDATQRSRCRITHRYRLLLVGSAAPRARFSRSRGRGTVPTRALLCRAERTRSNAASSSVAVSDGAEWHACPSAKANTAGSADEVTHPPLLLQRGARTHASWNLQGCELTRIAPQQFSIAVRITSSRCPWHGALSAVAIPTMSHPARPLSTNRRWVLIWLCVLV